MYEMAGAEREGKLVPAARAETDVPRLYLDTRRKYADHWEGPLSATCTPAFTPSY